MIKNLMFKTTAVIILIMVMISMIFVIMPSSLPIVSAANIIPITAYTTECAVEPYTSLTSLSSLKPDLAIDGLISDASRWAYGGFAVSPGDVITKYVTYDLGSPKTFNVLYFYMTRFVNFDFDSFSLQYSNTLDASLINQTPLAMAFTTNTKDDIIGTTYAIRKYTAPQISKEITARYIRLAFSYKMMTDVASASPPCPVEIVLNLGADQSVQDAYDTLQVGLGSNLHLDYVTTNLTLPTSLSTATITWSSDNAAISNDGVVTKPAAGKQVVNLTATISKIGCATQTKTFVVTVCHEVSYNILTINNGLLSASYNETISTFSVSDLKTNGTTFLKEGHFTDIQGTAAIETITDTTLGTGQTIKITYPNGNIDYISLFPNVSFALFKSVKANKTASTITLNRINTLYANVDLGVDYSKIQTMGTGGLYTPDANPGSYVYLATVDPETRRGVVSGWLTHERGSGIVFSRKQYSLPSIFTRLDYGTLRIPANSSETTQTFVVGYFDDARTGLETYTDLIARVYKITLRPPLAGYSTWASDKHGQSSDETYVPILADYAAQNLKPFGFDFLQMDNGWQMGTSTNGPNKNFNDTSPTGKFPSGMKAVADKIKAKGILPGLWLLPFSGTYNDPFFADKQSLFVKTQDGKPYDTYWGGTCLDMTNPAAKAYVATIINRICKTWGYKFLKMDGIYTGLGVKMMYVSDAYREDNFGESVLYDPNKTNVDAYRDGLKQIRASAGDDVFFLSNIIQNMRTFGASIGLVDAMRVGTDNSSSWSRLTFGPIYGSRFYFLNGRIWYNDPDTVYVRNSMPINQSRYITSWVGISGQLTLDSDWLPDLNADRLNLLKRIYPSHGLKAQPVDFFDRAIPKVWLVSDNKRVSNRNVIGLFNSDATDTTITETFDRIGLAKNTVYEAYDFWNKQLLPQISGSLSLPVPAQDARVIAVRPISNYPQVISTSRHITQGMVDLKSESWNNLNCTLSGVSQVVAADPYEVSIVARYGDVSGVDLSAADKSAGATISCVTKGNLITATIHSPTSRDVSWSVKFYPLKPFTINNIACSPFTLNSFSVEADITNATVTSETLSVFVAAFSKTSGKLLSIKSVDVPINASGNVHLNQTMQGVLNDCNVKIFIWEKSTFKPLAFQGTY